MDYPYPWGDEVDLQSACEMPILPSRLQRFITVIRTYCLWTAGTDMATQHHSPTSSRDVRDLLAQITEHGTPLRIDDATGTYYVLSAYQLMTLLRSRPDEVESVVSCTPQDFGLTEAEMAAYDARHQSRRQRIDHSVLAPLDAALEQRLRQWQQVQRQRPLSQVQKREREQLLHELEMAMMRNLQALTEQTR